MIDSNLIPRLAGQNIEEVFRLAEEISSLYSCLTSPRGDYFRLRLLQAMEAPVEGAEIEKVQVESGVEENLRHLNKLLFAGLISSQEFDTGSRYTRTELGDRAINALREFQRSVGEEEAKAVYSAALGPNSIRFFLRIYGNIQAAPDDHADVRYNLAEVGRMSLFLPRIIEGISATDKLNEAGMFIYGDDGYCSMPPVKARAFYRYLREQYGIVKDNGRRNKRRCGCSYALV